MASSTADGSVVIDVDMNVSQAEKRLGKLRGNIKKTEKEISDMTAAKEKAQQKSIFQAAELDAEKMKLQEIKDRLADIRAMSKDKSINIDAREEYKAQIPAIQQELNDQQARVRMLQTEWSKTENSVDRYSQKIESATQKLSDQKTEAGILTQEIDEAVKKENGFAKASAAAEKSMDRMGRRITELVKSAFIFNAISAGLRSIQQLTMKYIKTNNEARQAIAQLKGALLTLAQPLIEVIIPAFTLFVNILTKIITAVAQFVSLLFGKTIKQSQDGAKALHKEANAIKGVGEAAEEAAGSLAGFDEINTISTENASGAGGGGTSDVIAPDFSEIDSGLTDRLREIADLVGLIAAGLALWKISEFLPGVLGTIAEKLAGLLLTIGGLLLLWNGLTDAWENGVDWLNLIEMIGGLAAAALGLYLLLGPIAAGIALIVGGLALLVTGFHDAMENGWSFQNVLLSIAGILATGLGISLLTGSWIPLLIAGIASVLLALTVATGHGEELLNGIREIVEGFRDFFVGVFTGDIEKAVSGITKIFEGLKKSINAVIDGVRDTLLNFLDWIDEKTNGKFQSIIKFAKDLVSATFDFFEDIIGTGLDYMRDSLEGLIEFIGGVFTLDWDKAWKGLQKIVDAPAKAILGWIKDIILWIGKAVDAVKEFLKLEGSRSGTFGTTTSGFGSGSRMASQALPSIAPVSIPALAQGAVIPPNREFMAVLGDQRSGYNIEAPADLIRQMVIEGIQAAGVSGGNNQPIQVNVMLDKRVLARAMVNEVNDMTRQAGKPVLLF